MKTEVETLLRARYSIIYVITCEEERVIEEFKEISTSYEAKLLIWSLTSGLRSIAGKASGLYRPEDILNYIYNYPEDEKTIFLLLDFHPYLNNPSIQSYIKNLSRKLRNTRSNLILVSPVMEIPAEIKKEIKIIEYPLPDYKTIEETVGRIFSLKNMPLPEEKVKKKLINSCKGLTLKEIEKVLSRSFQEKDMSLYKIINREKKQIVRKNGLMDFYSPSIKFSHLGGFKRLKEWLLKRGLAFVTDKKIDLPRGILLLGIPGCGKSLLAEALSGEWNMPLLKLDTGRLFSPLMGSSEANLRRAILLTESVAPVILWVDNVDRGFSGVKRSTDSGVSKRIFGTFINWLQERSSPVFVLATANSISGLPPEFLRKGRFDEIFFIDLPGLLERKEIFKIMTGKFCS